MAAGRTPVGIYPVPRTPPALGSTEDAPLQWPGYPTGIPTRVVAAVFNEPGLQISGLALGALDFHGRTVGGPGWDAAQVPRDSAARFVRITYRKPRRRRYSRMRRADRHGSSRSCLSSVAGAFWRLVPSTSRSGRIRFSRRGSHQSPRPARASTAGTSVTRTAKASIATPLARASATGFDQGVRLCKGHVGRGSQATSGRADGSRRAGARMKEPGPLIWGERRVHDVTPRARRRGERSCNWMGPRRTSRPDGLFVGLCTLDVIQLVDHVPAPDEKLTAREQTVAAGGPAANAAVTFAYLGAQPGCSRRSAPTRWGSRSRPTWSGQE